MTFCRWGQKEGRSLQADPVEARLGPELGCSSLALFTLGCRISVLWIILVSLHYIRPSSDDTKTVSIHSVPEG